MHFRFAHDFDLEPKDYWDLFLSDEFNVELYQRLKMKKREVLEKKDEGNLMRRVQRFTPSTEMPAMIQSLVSDISYTEINELRRDKSEMTVVIEPAMMKNKFDFKALYSVKPLAPGKCRRAFEGDVKVSVMLVGGQMEKFMVDQMATAYDTAAKLTREWIERRKAQAPVA